MSRYPSYIPAHLYGIHKLTKTKLTPIIVINILNFEKRLIYPMEIYSETQKQCN